MIGSLENFLELSQSQLSSENACIFTDFKPFRIQNYANLGVRIFRNQKFVAFATIEIVLGVVGLRNFFLSKGMNSSNHSKPLIVIEKCVKNCLTDLKVMGVTTKTHKL